MSFSSANNLDTFLLQLHRSLAPVCVHSIIYILSSSSYGAHRNRCERCKRVRKVPKSFSDENDMDPEDVPADVRIASASPIMRVYRLNGDQKGHRGAMLQTEHRAPATSRCSSCAARATMMMERTRASSQGDVGIRYYFRRPAFWLQRNDNPYYTQRNM